MSNELSSVLKKLIKKLTLNNLQKCITIFQTEIDRRNSKTELKDNAEKVDKLIEQISKEDIE